MKALQQCNTEGGPIAGADNFYRGGELKVYDEPTRQAIASLKDKILADKLSLIWEKALSSCWQGEKVWVHGDIALGNLLINQGELSAVIDFGQLAVGDPAGDLALYWTLFQEESQIIFRQRMGLDTDTWDLSLIHI